MRRVSIERAQYPSVDKFVATKRQKRAEPNVWQPSKAQMVRDMRTIFGTDWAARRGGGERGRGGCRLNAETAPGLCIPENARKPLHSSNRPSRKVVTINSLAH